MSLSLHSLFPQKKGAVQGFVLLAVVAAMVIGILSVTAAHSKTVTISPIFVSANVNQTYNITITNAAGSASISRIEITKPSGFTAIYCLNADPAGSWTCSINGTAGGNSLVRFSSGTLAAGSSMSLNITSTSAAGAANYSFDVETLDADSSINTTKINVTVDPHPPMVDLVNISDGTNVLDNTHVNGLSFLKNTSGGIIFVINVTDNSSGMAEGAVNLYYNLSNLSVRSPLIIDYRNDSTANVSMFTASNRTLIAQSTLYNVTLNISAMPTLNGTRVAFQIVANDSVHNGNVSNASVVTSSYVYNFTIDAVAPQFVDVQIVNQSLNDSTAVAINTTKVFGSGTGVEYILNSSLILNVSVLVRDDGGSGTVKVELMNRSGAFMAMDLLTGANGSSTQTTWNFSAFNITDLVMGFAVDGLYNLTFRATDNVSNVNNTYNFTIEVDNTPPTGNAFTNITQAGSASLLSSGNATISNTSLNSTAFVIRLQTANNINNVTRNVSVFGNEGLVFNLTYESGSAAGTSVWNLTVVSNASNSRTAANLTNLCNTLAGDGTTCNLRFNFSDVMGRENNAINLTIAVDGLAPNVSILSPVSFTTNYTGTVLINVSVNDTVGPVQNVSFRIRRNMTADGGIEGFYSDTQINVTNVTNWIPMSLGTGSNAQFLTNGTWNFTVNLTALNFSDGINYTIEINVTDSAGRQNASVNVSKVVFDSSRPTNFTIMSGFNTLSANSFQRVNFTINVNLTETVSGVKNVSLRIENSTNTFPWVPAAQLISSLGVGVFYNFSDFNITHVGSGLDNLSTNATNGNFTLRLNVTDTAGNQNTSVTLNFTIDTVVPSGISITFPGNNQNQSTNFTINVSVSNESNINTVQYRWENGTYVDQTSIGSNVSDWINMNSIESVNNSRWNTTFNITQGTPADGNYTIAVNITDKAGNSNTSALGNFNNSALIRLLFDQSRPEVVAVGSLANSQQTGSFVINMTTRDNRSFLNVMGLFNVSNINATAVRLENNTFNSSWQNISFPTTDLANANSNRTNVTFEFTSVANGLYNIRFWVNDTAGNQNSTVTINNLTLDNVAPSVAVSIVNVSPAASGGIGLSGTIAFNATITDNLPLNISIANETTVTTTGSSATYGVFYRFENATHTMNWTSMSTPSFFNTVHNNTGTEHKAVFNASNVTATLADGDYTIRINATDKAGNQNTTQTMSITVQNGGTSLRTYNFTFSGGYVTGSDTNQTSPTLLLNTSENATCLYALDDTTKNYYGEMLPQTAGNTMGNNISKQHSTALGFRPDRAANGYAMYYACKDVNGNFSSSLGAVTLKTFSVDTRNFFNITIGSAGTNKVRGDYFATGWNSFTLPKTTLLANTGVPTNYNITNVLSSLGSSTLATANFTVVYAHNGSAWASYRVGGGANTFNNFTADTPTATYYLNITAANERLEIN